MTDELATAPTVPPIWRLVRPLARLVSHGYLLLALGAVGALVTAGELVAFTLTGGGEWALFVAGVLVFGYSGFAVGVLFNVPRDQL